VREQYNNVLRSSNNRAQQKKMAFLERNLEQLTHVQRQLVEQNSSLKKEVAIAERKLIARNERIQSLESLLHDSQEKLIQANHRFVAPPFPHSVKNQYSPRVSQTVGSRFNSRLSRNDSRPQRPAAQDPISLCSRVVPEQAVSASTSEARASRNHSEGVVEEATYTLRALKPCLRYQLWLDSRRRSLAERGVVVVAGVF
jgi:hypothetical protein